MIKIKTKKNNEFKENRLVFFAEIPKFQEGELASLKQKKEKEGPELDIAGLVNESNRIIDGYTAQLNELPTEFNQMLHNEIVKYFLASPSRYEKDENTGLSVEEFNVYRKDMLTKVTALMKEYAPTEEDIKAVKEAKESGEVVKEKVEKVEPLNIEQVTESPGKIESLFDLNNKFSVYANWNASLQKEGSEVLESSNSFNLAFSKYDKARKGIKAYKKFMAYLWPENDKELIELQNKLAEAKSKVASAIAKFEATKEKLKKHGSTLGESSNRLKKEKIEERDEKLKQVKEMEDGNEESRKSKEQQYKKLEDQKKEAELSRNNLLNYREEVEKGKEKFSDKVEKAREKQKKLTEFSGIINESIEKIKNNLSNPYLPPETRAQLEQIKDKLEGRREDAGDDLGVATSVLEAGEEFVMQLDEAEKKVVEKSLSLDEHIKQQLDPAINGLDAFIANLDEGKIQFATTKAQVNTHYKKAFEDYDNVDNAVDSAVMQNNIANESILNSLKTQRNALNGVDLKPPSGVLGGIESTVGVVFSTIGGAVSTSGEFLLDQAIWMSKSLEDSRSEMNVFSYVASRIGVEVVNSTIGVGGGLIEMVGGLVNFIAHPVDSVKGLGVLIGLDSNVSAGDAWKEMGKALISYEDFKKGHIGIGVGKLFANVATTVTGAGALGAGGKAGAVAYKTARVAGAGVTKSMAKAGVVGTKAGVVYTGTAIKGGAKKVVELPSNIANKSAKIVNKAKVYVKDNKKFISHIDDTSEVIHKTSLNTKSSPKEPIGKSTSKTAEQGALEEALTELTPVKSKELIELEEALTELSPKSKQTARIEEPTVDHVSKPKEIAKSTEPKRSAGIEEPTIAHTPKSKQSAGIEEPTIAHTPKSKQTAGIEEPTIDHVLKPRESAPHKQAPIETPTIDNSLLITPKDRIEALNKLTKRVSDNPELAKQLNNIAIKNKIPIEDIGKLDSAELQLLAEMPLSELSSTIMERIIKKEFIEVVDVLSGQKTNMRYYIDDTAILGAGGIGNVHSGYAVNWVKDASGGIKPVLQRGAIKQIKEIVQVDNFSFQNMMKFEEETLNIVRNLSSKDGLLYPKSFGWKVIKDAEGNIIRREIVSMTELIEKLPNVASVGMRDVIEALPLDQSLKYFDDILEGMEKLHKSSRMHMDIKLSNFFVGNVDGRTKAVLGDLSAVPAENLRHMMINKIHMIDGKVIYQVVIKLPDGKISIPVTPEYMNRGIKQLRYAIEWAKEYKKVPESIVSITDLGQTARAIEAIQSIIKQNPKMIPKNQASTINARLQNIINKIDDIPDIEQLNIAVNSAISTNDQSLIASALSKRKSAMNGPPSISVKEVRKELQEIIEQIKKAQRQEELAQKMDSANLGVI